MSYPGDTSLSNEIKERILTTFEQALDLSESGSRKEALLGCDFVLRLDPLFEPARVLYRRLRDTETEVATEDLRSTLGDPSGAAEEPAPATPEAPDETDHAVADAIAEDLGVEEPAVEGESFADRVEAELEASFPHPSAPDTDPAAGASEEHLSPDTNLSEPSLSGPSFDQPAEAEPAEPAFAQPASIFEAEPDSATDEPGAISGEDQGEPPPLEPQSSSVQLDPESLRRISELLDEGQDAFDIGEYQSAIDSWSRVFLIDIDHSEANRRIEDARRMAAEAERQVEEVFHEAMSRLDEGDLEGSREALNRVLQMQPTHLAALEYLERIDAGDVAHPELPDPTDAAVDLGFGSEPLADEDASEGVFLTPDLPSLPDEEIDSSTSPVKPPKPRRKSDPRRLFVMVGSAVLVLVLIGGWFLYDNWSMFFPNSQSAQDVPPPTRIDPIRRAQALHDEGKTAIAIAQLRRLPPGDPHYAEAQALVAQWETTAAEDAPPEGPTPEELESFRMLVADARAAHAAGENLLTADLLERAATIASLDEAALAMQADAEVNLAALRNQIEIFRSGDWEYALPTLWRMREADLDNADVTRLIVDSYYNLGVRDLQRGRPEAAMRKFEEALSLRPDDRTLTRLRVLADTYQTRPEDLLYRIFVKYLPFR